MHNERESIRILHEELEEVLRFLGRTYEIIFVDDGSADGTTEVLRSLCSSHPELLAVYFPNRRGQSAAFETGFALSSGDVVITLDADLQNNPRDIPRLLEKLEEGYDVVCGWRTHRCDPWHRRWSSGAANFMRRRFLGEKIHDVGCSLRVYRKQVLRKLSLGAYGHRFITALLLRSGLKVCEVSVRHHPRRFGRSKYNLRNRFYESTAGFVRLLLSRSPDLFDQKQCSS